MSSRERCPHCGSRHARRRRRVPLVLLVLLPLLSFAQLSVVNVETLPLGNARSWSQPRWSPDGRTVYYTASDFDGIWAYSSADGKIVRITADRQSGYGFSVSEDGRRIAWRRAFAGAVPGELLREVVVRDILEGTSSVLASGKAITLPVFVRSDVVYSAGGAVRGLTPGNPPSGSIAVLGIEDAKIAVLRGGEKVFLDPLGSGTYNWPSLSRDAARLVAYEVDRGAFVSAPDGSQPRGIGHREAPEWTRDGKWIVYMKVKREGEKIRSSGIAYVSPDGKTGGELTAPARRVDMYPRCSPVDNRIVCSTLGGEILVITYIDAPLK